MLVPCSIALLQRLAFFFHTAAEGAAESSGVSGPAVVHDIASPCAPQCFCCGIVADATAITIERRQELGDGFVDMEHQLDWRPVAPEECNGCVAA